MTWSKGESGNPKGRVRGSVRKSLRELRELAEQDAPTALRVLVRLAQLGETEENPKTLAVARAAANDLLTWAFGKPSSWAEEASGLPADITKLPLEQQLAEVRKRRMLYEQAEAALAKGSGVVQ